MSKTKLSQKELFHFALHASKTGRSDQAILYLKEYLKIDSTDVDALFLVGSEYAEIGMIQDGIGYLQQALEQAPEAHLIRFQLAMLHFTLNQTDISLNVLKALLDVDASNPFNRFATGITALINDDVETCISLLNEGLAMELNNLALTTNIEKLIQALQSPEGDRPQGSPSDNNKGEMFLSVYKS